MAGSNAKASPSRRPCPRQEIVSTGSWSSAIAAAVIALASLLLLADTAAAEGGQALRGGGSAAQPMSSGSQAAGAQTFGDEIRSGDQVRIRAKTGRVLSVSSSGYLEVVDATVEAGIDVPQSERFLVERVEGEGFLEPGDMIFLQLSNQKRITVVDKTVLHALWDHKGLWQKLTVRGKTDSSPIRSGDSVFLKTWLGTNIDADGMSNGLVRALYTDQGSWQELELEKVPFVTGSVGPTLEPGTRVTGDGCVCQRTWVYHGQWCNNFCCNPDNDEGGDWCYTVDSASCPSSVWGTCLPPAPEGQPAPTPAPPQQDPDVTTISARAWEFFQKSNEVRRRGHTCPNGAVFTPNANDLKYDCRLMDVAVEHSKDMMSRSYVSADPPSAAEQGPLDRAKELGVEAQQVSVVALTPDAQSTVGLLLASDLHCKVLMNPGWTTIGTGYASGGVYDHYWTQIFSNSDTVLLDEVTCQPPAGAAAAAASAAASSPSSSASASAASSAGSQDHGIVGVFLP